MDEQLLAFLSREKCTLVLLAIYSHRGVYVKTTESETPTPLYIFDLGGVGATCNTLVCFEKLSLYSWIF